VPPPYEKFARREVTHCELLPSVKALIAAAYDFFDR
jgi:hypothetical protein